MVLESSSLFLFHLLTIVKNVKNFIMGKKSKTPKKKSIVSSQGSPKSTPKKSNTKKLKKEESEDTSNTQSEENQVTPSTHGIKLLEELESLGPFDFQEPMELNKYVLETEIAKGVNATVIRAKESTESTNVASIVAAKVFHKKCISKGENARSVHTAIVINV